MPPRTPGRKRTIEGETPEKPDPQGQDRPGPTAGDARDRPGPTVRDVPDRPGPTAVREGSAPWRRPAVGLLILFVVAFGIRLGHDILIRESPYFLQPPGDGAIYHSWAERLSTGSFDSNDPYYRAPLYPYFLSLVYRAFGTGPLAPRLLQALLDSLGCLLIWGIGRKAATERTAWIAGGLAALYGPFIFFQGMLVKATLGLFLIEGTLLCLLLSAEGRGRKWILGWGCSGILFGLSALVRPNFLILFPFFIGWGWWACRRSGRARALLGIAVFAVATFIPILPVTLRNVTVGSDIVLISANGGQNFYIGNNEHNRTGAYHQFQDIREHPAWEETDFGRLAVRLHDKPMKSSEVSRFYFREGLKFIRTYPGKFLLLQGKKVLLLLNGLEVRDNQNYHFAGTWAPLLRLPLPGFYLVAPLGLAGLVLLCRRGGAASLLAIYVGAYSLSLLAFYVLSRYRIPIAPALIVFAAAAVDEAYLDFRRGGVRRAWKWGAWAAGFAILVNFPLPFMSHQVADSHVKLGRYHLERGEVDEAAREFETALEIASDSAGALSSLGGLRLRRGDLAGAEEAYLELSRLRPELGEARYNLGVVYQATNRPDKALEEYFACLEIQPEFLPAYRNLALLLDEMGKPGEAVMLLGSLLKTQPLYAEGRFTRGLILEGQGEYAKALIDYRSAADGGYPPGPSHFKLASCYAALGETEKAVENLEAMRRIGYEPSPQDLQDLLSRLAPKKE